MKPNDAANTPTPQPYQPGTVITGGSTNEVQSTPQTPPPVKVSHANYTAAVFFTLLIAGFTFNLPAIIHIPLIFFCVAAGVLFFRDAIAVNTTPQVAPGQPGVYYTPEATPKKKGNPIINALFIIFAAIGVCILLYVGFIVLIVIMFASSGV